MRKIEEIMNMVRESSEVKVCTKYENRKLNIKGAFIKPQSCEIRGRGGFGMVIDGEVVVSGGNAFGMKFDLEKSDDNSIHPSIRNDRFNIEFIADDVKSIRKIRNMNGYIIKIKEETRGFYPEGRVEEMRIYL